MAGHHDHASVPEVREGLGAPVGAKLGATLRATGGLLTRNRLFAGALGVGAALRLAAMLGYPGVLWFPGDSYLYLGAALRPRPDLSKTIGYSFLLRALEPSRSLTLVALIQHLMGLSIAVMIYALARRSRLPRWGATLAAVPVLLDGYQVQLEHMLMSDTLFAFLVVAAVTLALWRDRPAPWVMLGAGLITGYAVLVREAGLPLIAVMTGYFVARWRGWRVPVALLAGCALPIMAYGAWFHAVNGQYTLTRSTGFYLWGRVSSFADCARIRPPAPERRLCLSQPAADRAPPGRLVWINPTARDLPGGPVSVVNDKLMTHFAVRAITAQPFGYFSAIATGVRLAVDWHRHPYPGAYTVSKYQFPCLPQLLPSGRTWIPGGTPAADVRAYGRARPSRVAAPWSAALRVYQRYVYTNGPLFGLILLTGLAGLIRRWRRLGGAGLLPCAAAVTLLLFPLATADFDYRYLLAVLPFACLAAALAFARDIGVPSARARAAQAPGQSHETLGSWRVAQTFRIRPSRSGGSS